MLLTKDLLVQVACSQLRVPHITTPLGDVPQITTPHGDLSLKACAAGRHFTPLPIQSVPHTLVYTHKLSFLCPNTHKLSLLCLVPCVLCRMGIVLAIVLPPSHEETPITNLRVHVVPSDAGYVVVLFLWLQVSLWRRLAHSARLSRENACAACLVVFGALLFLSASCRCSCNSLKVLYSILAASFLSWVSGHLPHSSIPGQHTPSP